MNEKKIIKMIAASFKLSTKKINLNTHFLKDLGTDSLKMLELIADIETTFSIKIDNEKLYGIKTVKDLVALVNSYPANKAK